jgi:adenine-specific DNA-methyltransferase
MEALKKDIESKGEFVFQNDEELRAKVEQTEQLGLHFLKEPSKRFFEMKSKLDAARVSEDTERAIYNELFRFFDRYYEGGDFISKPRSGANNYMIPYNGEEVKLYWANHDQYYIKTGENFKNYIFTNNASTPETRVTVEFKIVDAETTVNNNKNEKKRLFVPAEKAVEWNADTRTLTVCFYYKEPSPEEKSKWGEKQNVKSENKGINQKLFIELEKHVKKAKEPELVRVWEKTRKDSKGNEQPALLYHLNRYTSINSFDYFIHKDLKGFLSRELDYFLKNEVLSVNFLDPNWNESDVQGAIKLNVLKAGAIRDLALAVIEFLAELEEFQKKLFEKKKFAVQSDYCLTLDRIPSVIASEAKQSLLDEVLEFVLTDTSESQIKEWIQLGFISGKKDLKHLKKELNDGETRLKYLVLDTQFLPPALKWKLLSSIDNLDERTNGLLINSENWQAINFVKERYEQRIKCIYIDPPFNSKSSEIIYKNYYKHSSWLGLMRNRLELSKRTLLRNGVIVIAIDENEQERLGLLLDAVFPEHEKTCVSIVHNPSGQQGDNFSYTHEFAYFIYPVGGRIIRQEDREDYEDIRNFRDVTGEDSLRESAANCFYPILVKDDKIIGFGSVCDDTFHPKTPNIFRKGNVIEIYPIDPQKIERKWRYARQTVETIVDQLEVKYIARRKVWDIIRKKTEFNYKTVWVDSKYSANNHGTQLLNQMFGEAVFTFPKSINTVIECIKASTNENEASVVFDYFAGSGTTAHAVIQLNRLSSESSMKFILTEMANYFDTVTKPRVQKVVFSDKWKEGKPETDGKGVSQIFQYLKLEQYEDALNNIEFAKEAPQLSIDDQLRYQLTYGTEGSESLLNVDKFANPFGYTMKIVRMNEVEPEQPIDLVTTFNFFLGIDVRRYVIEEHQGREYRIVLGKKRQQEYVVVWRKFEEGKLDLTKEKQWVEQQPWFDKNAIVLCNADNAFGARSTEAEFKRIMLEPVQ